MAISTRSRRGTSPSFWRNHNAMQDSLVRACMPSVKPALTPKPVPQSVVPSAIVGQNQPAPKVYRTRIMVRDKGST